MFELDDGYCLYCRRAGRGRKIAAGMHIFSPNDTVNWWILTIGNELYQQKIKNKSLMLFAGWFSCRLTSVSVFTLNPDKRFLLSEAGSQPPTLLSFLYQYCGIVRCGFWKQINRYYICIFCLFFFFLFYTKNKKQWQLNIVASVRLCCFCVILDHTVNY